MKDKVSFDEKMEKFVSLRSKGILSEIDNIKGPERDEPGSFDDDEEDEDIVLDYIEPGSEREKEGIEYAKQTCRCMFISFYAVSAVFLLLGLIFFGDRIKYCAGILTGVLSGTGYIRSLNLSVREVLNFDENTAEKSMKKQARIRLIAVGAAGGVICALVGGSAVYGVVGEILAIKLGAYLTPLTMKIVKADP